MDHSLHTQDSGIPCPNTQSLVPWSLLGYFLSVFTRADCTAHMRVLRSKHDWGLDVGMKWVQSLNVCIDKGWNQGGNWTDCCWSEAILPFLYLYHFTIISPKYWKQYLILDENENFYPLEFNNLRLLWMIFFSGLIVSSLVY